MSAERLYDMALRAYSRAQFDAARALAEASLELGPERHEPWLLIADVHLQTGRETAALAGLARAAALAPRQADVRARQTRLLLEIGRTAEAAETAAAWRRIEPDSPEAAGEEAHALARAGNPAALAAFEALLSRDPGNDVAAYRAALLHLGAGDFARGWPLFERRHALDPHFVPLPLPRWTGGPLNGKRILVVPEGGHGDVIWAARFLPHVRAAGAEVLLVDRPALAALFANLDGVTAHVEAPPADADLWAPILSLPSALGQQRPEPHAARLTCRPFEGLPALIERARGRLKVGLIWSGSTTYGGNRHRAASLADLLPLVELPGVQFYSLQKGPPQGELFESGLGDLVIDAPDFDFAETGALARALDLIVMTDSAVAHLAGSLGVPVWLLTDTAPFWYHAGTGETSPWYPSLRLFRQKRPGDWSGPIARIRKELSELAD